MVSLGRVLQLLMSLEVVDCDALYPRLVAINP
jgi:hypothetical protein